MGDRYLELSLTVAAELLEPALVKADFIKAIHAVRPSVSASDVQKQVEWAQEAGALPRRSALLTDRDRVIVVRACTIVVSRGGVSAAYSRKRGGGAEGHPMCGTYRRCDRARSLAP